MSPNETGRRDGLICFPRVSGDEPELTMLKDCAGVFSPRERG